MKHALVVLVTTLAFAVPAAAQETAPGPLVVTPAPTVYAQPAPAPVPEAEATTPGPDGARYYAQPHYVTVGRRERTLLGTRHVQRNDTGLWGAGVGLFLGGWGLNIALTAVGNAISHDRDGAAEEDAQAWSLLPIVGPFIQLGIEAPHPAIPIMTGLVQITGLVMFIMGMTSTHDAEVPIYAFGDPHDVRTARIGMSIAPTEGGAAAAFTLHL